MGRKFYYMERKIKSERISKIEVSKIKSYFSWEVFQTAYCSLAVEV